MKRRIIAVLAMVAVIASLLVGFTGCMQATPTSTMTITSLEGAGERSFVFAIPADKDAVANDPDEDGWVGYSVYNNSSYFPQGYQALADYLMQKLGSDYKITVDESGVDNVLITLTYSFTSVADYTAKTKALVTEKRWTDCKFKDPAIYIEKIDENYVEEEESVVSTESTEATESTDDTEATESTESAVEEEKEEKLDLYLLETDAQHIGDLRYTFVESKFISSAVCIALTELVACQDAVDAGVFAPYGDSKKNEFCKPKNPEEHDLYNLAFPSNILTTNAAARTYTFMDVTYEETQGGDGIIACYVADEGQATTDPLSGGRLSLGSKPQYTIKDYLEYQNAEDTEYYTNLPGSGLGLGLILGIVGGVVGVAAIVVVVIAVIKKKNADDDDYEDDDDDDEEEDEE